MADAPKKYEDDYLDLAKRENTAEILQGIDKLRASKQKEVDQSRKAYTFPATYNGKMGLKEGHVTELRMFFHVKPGHAEALKAELRKFKDGEVRNAKVTHLMSGIHTMTCTLFDNDTRYLHTTEFDTEWDPYIEDSLPTHAQLLAYASWLQHLEEFEPFSLDNLPTANDVKVLFNNARETATAYIRTFGESNTEVYRMRDLKKAFEQVLDHPDAAKALEHPALKPLLEFAAS